MNDSPAPAALPPAGGLKWFFGLAALIAVVNIVLAFVAVPPALVPTLGIVVAILLMIAPITGLYLAGNHPWTPRLALAFVMAGILVQVTLVALALGPLKGTPLAAVSHALSQLGLMTWCAGLGALLATLIRDRNLLIPIAVFLIAFDVFLVLTPMGPTRAIMEAAPQILEQGGYRIARVQEQPTFGPVGAFAFVGPADFVFMAMFFIALWRDRLRVRATYLALAPVLVLYLAAVILFRISLPALVPIGLTVLAVNLPMFRLSRDEWVATLVVALLALGLIGWGLSRRAPPPAPSKPAPVSKIRGSAHLPARA